MILGIKGGDLRDIPLPHKRYYPKSGERRRVIFRISRYNISKGKHFWVTLNEENNPIWDSSVGKWCEPWEDREGRGKRFDSPGLDYQFQVWDWILKTFQEHFSEETHALYALMSERPIKPNSALEIERGWVDRYYYDREGD